ncbi:MAG: RluA family pseudouridine synthase [Prolixibacteraceae bacterium]|nr:RluA family pseudouridine synthase [Prolixibacteraceae bacterium]
MDILYEDNHIIAVNKKCGELVQGDNTGDDPLNEQLKRFLKEKYNKPGNVFCGVIHRIDRPTSGVLLFAKTSKALTRLNKMLSEKDEIKKNYWAVVDKLPEKQSDTLNHFLVRDAKQNKSFAFDRDQENAKPASLTYTHIASSDRYHLLEIELHTGRHHQIRAQLAKIGCHIKGDLKYGFPRSNKDAGIHLHARKVEFIHPVKKEPVLIVAPPPSDPVWDAMMDIVSA